MGDGVGRTEERNLMRFSFQKMEGVDRVGSELSFGTIHTEHEHWEADMGVSGVVSAGIFRSDVGRPRTLVGERDASPNDHEWLTALNHHLPRSVKWYPHFSRLVGERESYPALWLDCRFKGLPIVSGGILTRLAYDPESGRCVSAAFEFRVPVTPVHEEPPKSPEQLMVRLVDALNAESVRRGPRTFDRKFLTLGWSVESNQGDCRLVYLYDDYEQYQQASIRFALDAATGERVATPLRY